jgi:MFS family permease
LSFLGGAIGNVSQVPVGDSNPFGSASHRVRFSKEVMRSREEAVDNISPPGKSKQVAANPHEPEPSYTTLLRNRSFSFLWAGQLVSQSGDAVFDIALLWLVLVTTGSTALVGLTQAAVLIPAVLASPIAGVYADRFNRRNVMVASDLAQGVVLAAVSALYVASSLRFSVLILLVLMIYTCAQFYRAASNAIIPRMVSKENLGAANGLLSLTMSANQLVGYSLGGIVILALGPAVPITYDSLAFFVAAALMTFIARGYGRPKGDADGPAAETSFSKEFREGLGYMRRSRIFLQLIVFGLIVNFFGTAMLALLAPYAKLWVHGDASTYGFLAASLALGSIIGSVLVGRVNFRNYVGKLLFAGVVMVGALLVFAGVVTTVLLALVALFATGLVLAVVNVPLNALVQTQVPGEMLGRAGTVLSSLMAAAQPIGAVFAGVLAGLVSIGSVIAGSGVAVAATSVALYAVFRELRKAAY